MEEARRKSTRARQQGRVGPGYVDSATVKEYGSNLPRSYLQSRDCRLQATREHNGSIRAQHLGRMGPGCAGK